jgi:hypothetical protein
MVDAESASLEELLILMDGLRSAGTALPKVKFIDKAIKAICDTVPRESCTISINICAHLCTEYDPSHVLLHDGYVRFQASNLVCYPW